MKKKNCKDEEAGMKSKTNLKMMKQEIEVKKLMQHRRTNV